MLIYIDLLICKHIDGEIYIYRRYTTPFTLGLLFKDLANGVGDDFSAMPGIVLPSQVLARLRSSVDYGLEKVVTSCSRRALHITVSLNLNQGLAIAVHGSGVSATWTGKMKPRRLSTEVNKVSRMHGIYIFLVNRHEIFLSHVPRPGTRTRDSHKQDLQNPRSQDPNLRHN